MPPDTVPASAPRARRVALLLVGASLLLAAGGALWFLQFASQVRQDPALIYREPATLDKLLKRANDAERAGDRATAITRRGGAGGAQPSSSRRYTARSAALKHTNRTSSSDVGFPSWSRTVATAISAARAMG